MRLLARAWEVCCNEVKKRSGYLRRGSFKRRSGIVVETLGVDVLVPRTVLLQIEAHLFPYLRNDYFSKRVGAFKREFRFLRRRVISIVHDGITFQYDFRHERLPQTGAVGKFEVFDLD